MRKVGPYHFSETEFHRIVVLPQRHFTESLSCRKNITQCILTELSHSRIVELPKLHNAERHFSESSYSRTLFSRIVDQPNVIFPKYHLPERPEVVWSRTSFNRTLCDLINIYRVIQKTI